MRPSDIEPDDLIACSFVTVVVAALIWLVVALVQATRADGRVDFCIIENVAPLYVVHEHRAWRADGDLARATSLAEALQLARAADCPIGKPAASEAP